MSNEIVFPHSAAAADLYAVILSNIGQAYNGTSFENITDANWGNYDIPLTEGGTASQIYLGTFPAVAAGVYTIFVYEQAGGSPAVGDELLGAGKVDWSGTAETVLANLPAVILAAVIETGLTLKNALRLIAAAAAGKLSGADTATNTIRNAVADDKNRITATVDEDGNRTAITYDLTD